MRKLLLILILLPFTALAQDSVPAHPYIKFETTEGTNYGCQFSKTDR